MARQISENRYQLLLKCEERIRRFYEVQQSIESHYASETVDFSGEDREDENTKRYKDESQRLELKLAVEKDMRDASDTMKMGEIFDKARAELGESAFENYCQGWQDAGRFYLDDSAEDAYMKRLRLISKFYPKNVPFHIIYTIVRPIGCSQKES